MPYYNVIEAIEFSEVKIASNNKSILYILSLLTTEKETCKRMLIKPVKKGKTAVKTNFNEILKCNTNSYGINTKCKTFNSLAICKHSDVIDLSKDSCIDNLLTSKPHSCTEINNQHIPAIEEITPGMVLLNQFDDKIYIDESEIPLNGTYLIQFHNATVRAQQYTFQESEMTEHNPLPAMLQPPAIKPQIEELLSLEMLKELEAKNIKYIEELKVTNEKKSAAVLSLLTLILVVIVITLWKKGVIPCIICKKEINIENEASEGENNGHITTSSNENEPVPTPRTLGINDLPQHIKMVRSNEDVRF